MDDLLLKARGNFTEIPKSKAHSPARTRSIQARFRVDRFVEHEEAFEVLQEASRVHGEGPKTLVRALLHYRDTVAVPFHKRDPKRAIPKNLQIAALDFTPKARAGSNVKSVAVRLYVDKFQEHRQAYEFLKNMQTLHGEGNRTIVRALIHYRRTVLDPLAERLRA